MQSIFVAEIYIQSTNFPLIVFGATLHHLFQNIIAYSINHFVLYFSNEDKINLLNLIQNQFYYDAICFIEHILHWNIIIKEELLNQKYFMEAIQKLKLSTSPIQSI